MRKLTAIFLLLIMFFNMLGCYGLFLTIWHHNEQSLMRSFDKDGYEESRAITIKIPHHIPYVAERVEYQRVDGLFEHKGEFYRLVKQRITSDSIFVVCVKDIQSERINKALADYVKTFTDQPAHEKNTGKVSLNFSKYYYNQLFSMLTLSLGWESDVVQQSRVAVLVCNQYTNVAFHPPEAC